VSEFDSLINPALFIAGIPFALGWSKIRKALIATMRRSKRPFICRAMPLFHER